MGLPKKLTEMQIKFAHELVTNEGRKYAFECAVEAGYAKDRARITASELLSLKTTAKLNGDITTNKLSIEPGASFTGSCSMGAVIKDIKNAGKAEQKEKTA